MDDQHSLLLYNEHKGTIRVGHATRPPNCAAKAVQLLNETQCPHIDFFCVGEKASYTTQKVMSLFRLFLEKNTENEVTVSFLPFYVRTVAPPLPPADPNGHPVEIRGTVWRTVLLSPQQTAQYRLNDPTLTVLPPPDQNA